MLTVGSGINIGPGITLTKGTTGGSIQFGTNKYVKTASGSTTNPLSLGSSFTVECWFKVLATSPAGGDYLITKRTGSTTEYMLYITSGGMNWYQNSSSSTVSIAGPSPSINQWHHIAVVRNSSTVTMYLDGTSVGTYSNPYNLVTNTGAPLNLGYSGYDPSPTYFNGNLNNIRIVPNVAVYTSNFTPSTQNLTATQSANVNGSPSAAISSGQTVLLMNTPDGANFLQDTSGSNFTFTQGGTSNATSSTSAPF